MGMGIGAGSNYPVSATPWWTDAETFGNCADFLAAALNGVPSGYDAVVINHISGLPEALDLSWTNFANVSKWVENSTEHVNWKGRLYRDYLYRIVVAYKKKSSYTVNIDTAAYDAAGADAAIKAAAASGNGNVYDFSGSNGMPACIIFGHQHRDITGNTKQVLDDADVPIDDTTDGIPLFVTTTDNCGGSLAYLDPNDGSIRTEDTVTEQAFDVYTIDTTNRKVRTTRIGGGIGDRDNNGAWYAYGT